LGIKNQHLSCGVKNTWNSCGSQILAANQTYALICVAAKLWRGQLQQAIKRPHELRAKNRSSLPTAVWLLLGPSQILGDVKKHQK